jgi:hypothetical protein
MRRLCHAAFTILELAWKGILPVLGIAILLGLCLKSRTVPSEGVKEAGERVVARDNGDRARITLGVAEADNSSAFTLNDKDGNELMLISLRKNGDFNFSLGSVGGNTPSRWMGHRATNGTISLGVSNGKSRYRLEVRADGSSDVEVYSPAYGEHQFFDRLGVTSEGRPVRDLSSPEQ